MEETLKLHKINFFIYLRTIKFVICVSVEPQLGVEWETTMWTMFHQECSPILIDSKVKALCFSCIFWIVSYTIWYSGIFTCTRIQFVLLLSLDITFEHFHFRIAYVLLTSVFILFDVLCLITVFFVAMHYFSSIFLTVWIDITEIMLRSFIT